MDCRVPKQEMTTVIASYGHVQVRKHNNPITFTKSNPTIQSSADSLMRKHKLIPNQEFAKTWHGRSLYRSLETLDISQQCRHKTKSVETPYRGQGHAINNVTKIERTRIVKRDINISKSLVELPHRSVTNDKGGSIQHIRSSSEVSLLSERKGSADKKRRRVCIKTI